MMLKIKQNSGRVFDLSKVKNNKFVIEDIAYSSSNILIFGAHAKKYTLAERLISLSYYQTSIKDALMCLLCQSDLAIIGQMPSYITKETKYAAKKSSEIIEYFMSMHKIDIKETERDIISNSIKFIKEYEEKVCYGNTFFQPISSVRAEKYFIKRYYELIEKNNLGIIV